MQIGDIQNSFGRKPTPAVFWIMAVTVALFFVQLFSRHLANDAFTGFMALTGDGLRHFQLWRLVTYTLVHSTSDLWHILLNMLGLYWFGCVMEDILGTRRFIRLYVGCGIVGGMSWIAINPCIGQADSCVGASGAVLGVVGAFAGLFSSERITMLLFFFLPVTMTARTLAIVIGLVTLISPMFGSNGVAHAAHLGGGLAGYAYGRIMSRRRALLGVESRSSGDDFLARWFSNFRANLRRRQMRLHSPSVPDVPPTQAEVDRLLEKISSEGIDTLTASERRTLDQASELSRLRARRDP